MYLQGRRRRGLSGLTQEQYVTLVTQRTLLQNAMPTQAQMDACPGGGEGEYQMCRNALMYQQAQIQAQIAAIDAQLAQGVTPAPAPMPMPAPVTGPGGPTTPVVTPGPISPTPGALQPSAPGAPIAIEVEGGGGGDFVMPGHPGSSAPSSSGNGLWLLALAAGAVVLGG